MSERILNNFIWKLKKPRIMECSVNYNRHGVMKVTVYNDQYFVKFWTYDKNEISRYATSIDKLDEVLNELEF